MPLGFVFISIKSWRSRLYPAHLLNELLSRFVSHIPFHKKGVLPSCGRSLAYWLLLNVELMSIMVADRTLVTAIKSTATVKSSGWFGVGVTISRAQPSIIISKSGGKSMIPVLYSYAIMIASNSVYVA
jgi:hypothetical protein